MQNMNEQENIPIQNIQQQPNLQYNWLGVLEFLQDQYKSQTIKEAEWMLEKQQLQDKLVQCEGELKAQESINKDLIKRIKMLEFSLRQERYNKMIQGQKLSGDLIQQGIQDSQINSEQQDLIQFPNNVPKRRAKGHRPLLTKILQEVGLDDIFGPVNEQNENIPPNSQGGTNPHHKPSSTMIQFQLDEIHNGQQQKQNEQSGVLDNSYIQDKQNQDESKIDNSKEISARQISNTPNNNLDTNDNSKQNTNNITAQFNSSDDHLNQLDSTQQNKNIMGLKCTLRSHLDGVRDAHFCQENILVTVSEDCLVKLWDARTFLNATETTQIDPYFTLREHTGPLFTVISTPSDVSKQGQNQMQNVVYTAGSEGIIKCWCVLNSDQVDQYGPTENKNFCVGTWNCHDEAIWQLYHHPFDKLLLSSSADGTVKLWKILDEIEQGENQISGQCKQNYIYKPQNLMEIDIPTSITWVNSNLIFLASGYVNSSCVVLFDTESGKQVQSLKFVADSQTYSKQINRIVSHDTMSLLITGHEDKYIRFFDTNSNKNIKSVIGHTDSVTSVVVHPNKIYLSSVGHDGCLRTWDLRKYQCINDIPAHKKKYDESIHNLTCQPNSGLIATCGSDSCVKIFQSFE